MLRRWINHWRKSQTKKYILTCGFFDDLLCSYTNYKVVPDTEILTRRHRDRVSLGDVVRHMPKSRHFESVDDTLDWADSWTYRIMKWAIGGNSSTQNFANILANLTPTIFPLRAGKKSPNYDQIWLILLIVSWAAVMSRIDLEKCRRFRSI